MVHCTCPRFRKYSCRPSPIHRIPYLRYAPPPSFGVSLPSCAAVAPYYCFGSAAQRGGHGYAYGAAGPARPAKGVLGLQGGSGMLRQPSRLPTPSRLGAGKIACNCFLLDAERLQSELPTQVLRQGSHFYLSPSPHCTACYSRSLSLLSTL